MKTTTKAMRRSLYFVFVAVAVGGANAAALTGLFVASATAAPDPCAASEVARTVGSVATRPAAISTRTRKPTRR